VGEKKRGKKGKKKIVGFRNAKRTKMWALANQVGVGERKREKRNFHQECRKNEETKKKNEERKKETARGCIQSAHRSTNLLQKSFLFQKTLTTSVLFSFAVSVSFL
jgi:uncharacterized membrane protein YcjF (UPF0283 family)